MAVMEASSGNTITARPHDYWRRLTGGSNHHLLPVAKIQQSFLQSERLRIEAVFLIESKLNLNDSD